MENQQKDSSLIHVGQTTIRHPGGHFVALISSCERAYEASPLGKRLGVLMGGKGALTMAHMQDNVVRMQVHGNIILVMKEPETTPFA